MEWVKLGELITQVRGVSYKPSDIIDEYKAGYMPLLRANAIQNNKLNNDDIIYVDKSKVKEEQILQPEDILIAASSGSKSIVGKAAQFTWLGQPYTIGAFCRVIRPIGINPTFLKYYFMSSYYRTTISHLASGANINNIRVEMINNLDIPKISVSEQLYVSNILSSCESLIAKRREQIDVLDDLVGSIFFKIYENSQIEAMPLDELFDFIDGDRGSNYPKKHEMLKEGYCLFLNTKNVTKNGFEFEKKEFISKDKHEILKKGIVCAGDYVLTTRGTVGNIAYVNKELPFSATRINSGMLILRPKVAINSIYFQNVIRKTKILQSGLSGSAQPQLPAKNLKMIKFPMIELSLQNRFADYVTSIEAQKESLRASLSELETLFDALMQEAFSGHLN